MRRYGKGWNSPENKKKRSEAGVKASRKRWDDYHAVLVGEPVRVDPVPLRYRLTFEDMQTGRTEVIDLESAGKQQYRATVNGDFWKLAGWTRIIDRFRKSCVRASR